MRSLRSSRLSICTMVMLVPACLVLGWIFHGPLVLGHTVEGRVLVNGVPSEGAFFYAMPGGNPQGRTDAAGRFSIPVPIFFCDYLEVCVEPTNARRTKFGEVMVGPWWTRLEGFDIELGDGRR